MYCTLLIRSPLYPVLYTKQWHWHGSEKMGEVKVDGKVGTLPFEFTLWLFPGNDPSLTWHFNWKCVALLLTDARFAKQTKFGLNVFFAINSQNPSVDPDVQTSLVLPYLANWPQCHADRLLASFKINLPDTNLLSDIQSGQGWVSDLRQHRHGCLNWACDLILKVKQFKIII